MNNNKLTPSTLKVTASEDLKVYEDLEEIDHKSIAELLDEQEKNNKEKNSTDQEKQAD